MKFGTLKVLASAAAIAAVGFSASAETVLKLGSVAPSGSPWGKWINGVAAHIENISGGELKIELLLDAQVGDEQAILRQAVKGRLDIAYVSNIPLTLLAQEMTLISSPHLWDSIEQGSCAAHKHMLGSFTDVMEAAGVKPLAWMEVGNNVIFSKTPVKVPADLAGMKVRVAQSLAESGYVDHLNASPVPLGVADAIPAIQTGNVDAAIFPTVYGIAIGTHKVAPNVTVTNHARLIGTVSISKKVWDTLSAQEQEWLSSIGPLGEQLTAGILGAEGALLGQIEAAGLPVYYPTEEEQALWRASSEGMLEELVAEIGEGAPAIAAKLMAAKEACGS